MKGLVRYSLVASIGLGLIGPATAQGTVVTVGSPLTSTGGSLMSGSPETLANFALPEAGANVTSPVDGVVIRWRVQGASGGPFRLRVLKPVGGMTYTAVSSSAPETPASTDTQTFTTNLPLNAGDLIGLDMTNSSEQIGLGTIPSPDSFFEFWSPPLADGETRAGSTGTSAEEVLFNADVATIPSNADTLGKVKRNKHKGTAILAVDVPGPGTVALTGKGVKTQRTGRAADASKAVTAAGTVKLLVKPKGKAKHKLNKTGKAKVKVTVTYTPTGDAPGSPNTQTKRVKLVKKLG